MHFVEWCTPIGSLRRPYLGPKGQGWNSYSDNRVQAPEGPTRLGIRDPKMRATHERITLNWGFTGPSVMALREASRTAVAFVSSLNRSIPIRIMP